MTLTGWLADDFDIEKVVPLVANSLSMLTIMSCLFMKIPQIISITQKQSADGIFIPALVMEIVGFSIMTLYNYLNNYGAMTYMEYPIILFQVYVMMYFVLKYKGMLDIPIVPLMTAFYFATVAGFLMEILPKDILSYLVLTGRSPGRNNSPFILQPLCTPMSGFAKITYIYGIIKTGSAENMSLITWIISMLTNLSRVFTVYVDSADPKLLLNFFISTILSSGVLGTTIYYQATVCPAHRVVRRKPARRRSHND